MRISSGRASFLPLAPPSRPSVARRKSARRILPRRAFFFAYEAPRRRLTAPAFVTSRHATHSRHRRRPCRLRGRLADRASRRSRRSARNAPAARHRGASHGAARRARLLELLPLGRRREQRGRRHPSRDARAGLADHALRPTRIRCRPAARWRSTATASRPRSRRRSAPNRCIRDRARGGRRDCRPRTGTASSSRPAR